MVRGRRRQGGDLRFKSGNGAPAAANAIKVNFAYSPEKAKLLVPLIKAFNKERTEVDGRPVFIDGINASSGDVESRIAKGSFKPVAWSPASSLWGRLLNFEADQPYTAEEAPAIVRSPLVIAMWEPMARTLGWPQKTIGFADVLGLDFRPGLGRLRPARVRRLQARPYEPRTSRPPVSRPSSPSTTRRRARRRA